jgi:ribonucleoside-diphosphate reductase alpha chain
MDQSGRCGAVLLAAAGTPRVGLFLAEWKSLYDSGSGERGLFSRAAAQRQAARNGRRDVTQQQFGTNPCW